MWFDTPLFWLCLRVCFLAWLGAGATICVLGIVVLIPSRFEPVLAFIVTRAFDVFFATSLAIGAAVLAILATRLLS